MTAIAEAHREDLARMLEEGRPFLLEFWRPGCTWCRAQDPVLRQAAQNAPLPILRVNTDEDPGLAEAAAVAGTPTFIRFEGGRERVRRTGFQSEEALAGLLSAGFQP